MLESLLQFDQTLFFYIHHGIKNEFFDTTMPLWRSKYVWIPLYVLLSGVIVQVYGKKSWIIFVGIGLIIALSDGISSQLIKKNIKRIRPCNTELLDYEVNNLVACGSGYSFTSSHATNHFALAAFLSCILLPLASWIPYALFLWAASIGFGQVYVGVHYPFDVFAGALIGTLIGWVVAKLLFRLIDLKGSSKYF